MQTQNVIDAGRDSPTSLEVFEAGERRSTKPARSSFHHPCSGRRTLVPQVPGLSWAGLHGVSRLHGPGQLGDRSRGRRAVRLHAAVGHHDLEPDGRPATGARGTAWHRNRPRPRAGVPRSLSPTRQSHPVDRLRGRHHRLRSRRSDRHRDRASTVVRHPADRWRVALRARRLPPADADEPGLPLP